MQERLPLAASLVASISSSGSATRRVSANWHPQIMPGRRRGEHPHGDPCDLAGAPLRRDAVRATSVDVPIEAEEHLVRQPALKVRYRPVHRSVDDVETRLGEPHTPGLSGEHSLQHQDHRVHAPGVL